MDSKTNKLFPLSFESDLEIQGIKASYWNLVFYTENENQKTFFCYKF